MEDKISKEKLFDIARETRNFEITLFWKRSNYFLILNTAIATGFFSLKTTHYSLILGVFGLISSILWLLVNSGSKFWQSRWEQRLNIVEKGLDQELKFFAADEKTNREDVLESLGFNNHCRFRQFFDILIIHKPSVSFMMILLSTAFILLLIILIIFNLSGVSFN